MTISPEQFIKAKRGTEVSGWSHGGGQCVDEVREGMREVMGITGNTLQAIKGGNAFNFYENANQAYFNKISGPYIRSHGGLVLPEWAIVVLNHGKIDPNTGEPYGHVFNIFKDSTHTLLRGFGQNWTISRRCEYEAHGLSEVIGALVFRPEMRGR